MRKDQLPSIPPAPDNGRRVHMNARVSEEKWVRADKIRRQQKHTWIEVVELGLEYYELKYGVKK